MPEGVGDVMQLEMLLRHLHNWFAVRGSARTGRFLIRSGALHDSDGFLAPGQYYRIEGSVFCDGLHRHGDGDLTEEEIFTGTVTPLSIPRAVIDLAAEIAAWRASNPETDKQSESFGGYSYSRGSAGDGASSGWAAAFASRLAPWRRPYDD